MTDKVLDDEPHATPDRPRFRWKRWALAAVALLVGCGIYYAARVYWIVYHNIPEAYAGWTTADLVLDHLEAHGGAWPTGWADLRAAGEHRLEGHGPGPMRWDLGELERLVKVDWAADPKQLAAMPDGHPPFHAITRADGSDFPVVWQGAEPNQMILDYLKGRPRSY